MLKIKEQYYNIETLYNYGFKKEFESYKIRDNGIPLLSIYEDREIRIPTLDLCNSAINILFDLIKAGLIEKEGE